MALKKFEKAFMLMNETVSILQQAIEIPFIDAYTESVENMLNNCRTRIIDGEPEKEIADQLETRYRELMAMDLAPGEWRTITQLVLLQGTKTEQLQPNHQLTPDSIGLIFVYLIQSLYKKKDLQVLDIACGMGNLLLTIVLDLQKAKYKVRGYGVDIDETLLGAAAADTGLCRAEVQYFHQDGLRDLLIDPVDLVFADLPIGYYPNDERAEKFKSAAFSGHSYAHHLLMEQGMKYVKEAGFGLFLVPSNLLETGQGLYLKNWLRTEVYLQGMIQLPEEFFQSKKSRKSIILLQQKGQGARQAKEVLLANLGSLKDPNSMTAFLTKFEDWQSLNL